MQACTKNWLLSHFCCLSVEPERVVGLCSMYCTINLFILKHEPVFNLPQKVWGKKICNIHNFKNLKSIKNSNKKTAIYCIFTRKLLFDSEESLESPLMSTGEWWCATTIQLSKPMLPYDWLPANTFGDKFWDIILQVMSMERCNENGLFKSYKKCPFPGLTGPLSNAHPHLQTSSDNSLSALIALSLSYSM